MRKRFIAKIQLTSSFRNWYETDIDALGIEPADVINVIVENGGVYLIYWRFEDID